MRSFRTITAGFAILASLAGCSKSQTPPVTSKEITDIASKTDVGGICDPGTPAGLLATIARDETAKNALDKAAKTKPAKENFRKLYDAETAYSAKIAYTLARLTACNSPASALADLQAKATKSQANLTYLRESFPDFK